MIKELFKLKVALQKINCPEAIIIARLETVPDLEDTHFGTAIDNYQEKRLEISPEIIQEINPVNYGKIKDYKILLVDGTKVRNYIDPDFIGGGNPSRYLYIPHNEIWIETNTSRKDMIPYIIHEYFEAKAMKENGLNYQNAHEIATELEWLVRHNKLN